MKTISVRMDDELYKKLVELSNDLHISKNALIRICLSSWWSVESVGNYEISDKDVNG